MDKTLVFYQRDKKHEILDIYDHAIYVDGLDFNICLGGINIDDLFHNQVTQKKIKNNCEEKIEYLANNNRYYNEDFRLLADTLKRKDYEAFYKQFNLIQIDYNVDDGLEAFLEENKEYLRDKKILLPFYVYFGDKKLEEVKRYTQVIRKYVSNAHIVCSPVSGDKDLKYYVDVEDYFKAYEIRDNLLNLIKSLNLSPLEEVTFIYDYLKNIQYKQEEKGEPWYTSRGVIPILTGDKIVCMGYVALFKSLVEDLGHVHVTPLHLKKKDAEKSTHERAIIYIKDDKYGVNGNYIFDVTFDAKTSETEDNSNDYYFFLRTNKELDKSDEKMGYEKVGASILDEHIIETLERELPDVFTEEEFKRIIKDKDLTHNTILINMRLIPFWVHKEHNRKEDVIRIYKLIYESFNLGISYDNIIKLFYNIRKIEYYIDPDNVRFNYTDILDMVKTYLAPDFSAYYEKVQEIIKGNDGWIDNGDVMDEFVKEVLPTCEEDIKRVELTRTLRSYLIAKQKESI